MSKKPFFSFTTRICLSSVRTSLGKLEIAQQGLQTQMVLPKHSHIECSIFWKRTVVAGEPLPRIGALSEREGTPTLVSMTYCACA